MRLTAEQVLQDNNRFANCNAIAELKYCGWEIPQRRAITNDEIRFYAWLCRSAVAMLKEQEAIPVDTKVIGTFNGDIEVYCCRDCRTILDPAFHYCPNCGKAVKWNAVD